MITLHQNKGSKLSINEVDTNFIELSASTASKVDTITFTGYTASTATELASKASTGHTHAYSGLTGLPDIYTKTQVDTKISGFSQTKLIIPNSGYTVGTLLGFDGVHYVKPIASDVNNAEVVGVVTGIISVSQAELTLYGLIDVTGWGLLPNTAYFLSTATAGQITFTDPIDIPDNSGIVRKLVLITFDSNQAFFYNEPGEIISGQQAGETIYSGGTGISISGNVISYTGSTGLASDEEFDAMVDDKAPTVAQIVGKTQLSFEQGDWIYLNFSKVEGSVDDIPVDELAPVTQSDLYLYLDEGYDPTSWNMVIRSYQKLGIDIITDLNLYIPGNIRTTYPFELSLRVLKIHADDVSIHFFLDQTDNNTPNYVDHTNNVIAPNGLTLSGPAGTWFVLRFACRVAQQFNINNAFILEIQNTTQFIDKYHDQNVDGVKSFLQPIAIKNHTVAITQETYFDPIEEVQIKPFDFILRNGSFNTDIDKAVLSFQFQDGGLDIRAYTADDFRYGVALSIGTIASFGGIGTFKGYTAYYPKLGNPDESNSITIFGPSYTNDTDYSVFLSRSGYQRLVGIPLDSASAGEIAGTNLLLDWEVLVNNRQHVYWNGTISFTFYNPYLHHENVYHVRTGPNGATLNLPAFSYLVSGKSTSLSANSYYTVKIVCVLINNAIWYKWDIIQDVLSNSGGTPGVPVFRTTSPDINSEGFRLHWTNVAGATSYRLDISTTSNFSALVSGYNNLDTGQSNTIDVFGLNPTTTYYCRVRASNSSGTSGNSTTKTLTTISV
ncbi:fibronectin type III domain-containing protein [Xanthocytophaga agilis]|uniref:Fibronectin type-III domain-containing protein n=1 Tax=Xanthocytophaga agilis TaxID=3048010 RepID=A0AAE3R022_9BACT|nr:hypothetical protein [Xanthocytophaga agilis]MDJ1500645.1 hypothetical protein [Xanthocytophaga agilis]